MIQEDFEGWNVGSHELEEHLSCKGTDKVKAKRIIERIKQLTMDMEMLGENMRKWIYFD